MLRSENIMRKATSVKSKILTALSTGDTFTTKQLARKAKTSTVNVSRRVYDLRSEGYMVYANPVKKGNGVSYRIGTPTKAIIAAGIQAVNA
jgi:predicted ArsR family transcriptional regulator